MQLTVILRKVLIAAAVLSFTLGLIASCAYEHPTRKEHPEHPKGKEKAGVTLEDVAKFAEDYIQKNSKDGVFKYHDKNTGKDLELTLDKVHRDRLSQTKKDEYFVCADFNGKDDNMYDLDFFVQGEDKSELKVDEMSIAVHKVNGKENYTWKYNEKKGVWEKKTIEGGKEHPEPTKKEHPDYP